MMSMIFALVLLLAGGRVPEPAAQPAADHKADHHYGSQGYHRRFDQAEVWAKEFDDPARDAWQKPEEVLDALNLQPTAYVADLGAGTGYFSVRIAKRIPKGKLFAVDIEPDMVLYLRERAHREHLGGLDAVLGTAESPQIPEPVDLILLVDTYHHIDNRVAYFASLKQSLRPNGRLAVVDFKADSPTGPPPEHRISPEKLTRELDTAGYALVANHPFLPRQYFLVFQAKVP
jgi:SAM-dependent methyltransferase